MLTKSKMRQFTNTRRSKVQQSINLIETATDKKAEEDAFLCCLIDLDDIDANLRNRDESINIEM